MFSFRTVGDVTTISFDLGLVIESDWLTLRDGIFTFADTFIVNISNDTVLLVSKHEFQSARIGLHGNEPVEQGVITGATDAEKLANLLAHFAARGDITLG